jgi:alkylation response protein AidB-like acyl-CoA dehydrogenase
MITDPIAASDHADISDVVGEFTRKTFSSAHVREMAASELGYTEAAWKQMVELGWSGLGVSEDAGGAGLGAFVQCIVHRELGATLAPTPYLATAAFAATALTELGGSERARTLLAAIAGQPTAVALALGHGRSWSPAATPLVSASRADGGWVLDGMVRFVTDAARADTLLVVAAIGPAWGLFEVDASVADVSTRLATVDVTRSLGDVRLDATPARAVHAEQFTQAEIDALVDRLAVFLAAEMVGAGIACTNQTLDYLRTREQFGRQIGSFQALKHRCADLAVDLSTAHEIVFAAAQSADLGDLSALRLFAPLALARAGEVQKRAAEEAIQLHGGVGFTDELDAGHFYKRAIADAEILAAPVDAYARVDAVRGRWSA